MASRPPASPPAPGARRYTYATAGVDIAAGNALVKAISPLARSTARPGADAALGGFGGLFDLAATGYRDPLLVAANDGVGTKLKIAIETGAHDTVGIDLVAMCVNDLIVQGAEPLFFLDYFATGHLDVGIAERVVAGIAQGCRDAGCALIGGETAEMPGMYAAGDYDLAGFSVGAVERDAVLPRGDIGAGDVLLGLASNGVHSNGFSLVRRLMEDQGIEYDAPCPFDNGDTTNIGDVLLAPTRIYVRPVLNAIRETGAVKGLAHITGGGFLENIPRIIPAGLRADIDGASWAMPPVFRWLMELGEIEAKEMARTFNCGIGLVLIVDADAADAISDMLAGDGETVYRIGRLAAADDADRSPIHIDGRIGRGA